MTLRKLVLFLAILVAVYQFGIRDGVFSGRTPPAALPARPSQEARSSDALFDAYEHHRRTVQVEGSGVVTRVLRDDNDGSRHQRFPIAFR